MIRVNQKVAPELAHFFNSEEDSHLMKGDDRYGSKGNGLINLLKADIPVPPFFILPSTVFKRYTLSLPYEKEPDSLEVLSDLIKRNQLDPKTIKEIGNHYRKISKLGKSLVSVRPSIVIKENKNRVSFAGQLPSFLNVRGVEDIEKAIREVYASVFSLQIAQYLKANDLQYTQIEIAIVVQQMIQSEVSGVMYTVDPITKAKDRITIEAVFGLGDVIASGEINPDLYTVDKKSLAIVEKKVIPQDWLKVRRLSSENDISQVQKLKVSKAWRYSQKMEEPYITNLASLGKKIDQYLGKPQHLEWVFESGKLWVLQVRDYEAEIPDDSMQIESKRKLVVEKKFKDLSLQNKQLIFDGTGVNNLQAVGKALVVTKLEVERGGLDYNLLQKNIKKDTILVIEELDKEIENLLIKSGGVISNYGGLSSDLAIIARELGIPAVVGTRVATNFIKNGDLIYLDGGSGGVYKLSEEKNSKLVKKFKKEIKKETKVNKKELSAEKINLRQAQVQQAQVEKGKKEGNIAKPKPAFTNITKVWLQNPKVEDIRLGAKGYLLDSSQFKKKSLLKALSQLYKHDSQVFSEVVVSLKSSGNLGSYKLLEDKSDFNLLLKSISNWRSKEGLNCISLALNRVKTPKQLAELKRYLSSKGLRRSNTLNIYLYLDAPVILEKIDEFYKVGIDGLIFDFERYYALLTGDSTPDYGDLDLSLFDKVWQGINNLKKELKTDLISLLPTELLSDTKYSKRVLEKLLKTGVTTIIIEDGKASKFLSLNRLLSKVEKKML